MKLLISLLLSMGILASCQHRVDTPIHTQLSQNWEVSSDSIKALRATVPGTVYTDLLTAALIPDPFVLTNEAKVQWVAEQTWTYRTTFELTKAVRSRKHHLLNFEGIDTYADIYLNEQYIGTTNNAFTSYVYEVDSLLKASNTLRIVVHQFNFMKQKQKRSYHTNYRKAPEFSPEKRSFNTVGIGGLNFKLSVYGSLYLYNHGMMYFSAIATSNKRHYKTTLHNSKHIWNSLLIAPKP